MQSEIFYYNFNKERLKLQFNYHSRWYGDGLNCILDKLKAEFLRLWRSAKGETEPYAILRHCASLSSPSPLPPSFTSKTFPPTSSSWSDSTAGGRKTETRRVLPRAQETDTREIGGFKPWRRGYTTATWESGKKGTSAPPIESDAPPPPDSDATPGIATKELDCRFWILEKCVVGFWRGFWRKLEKWRWEWLTAVCWVLLPSQERGYFEHRTQRFSFSRYQFVIQNSFPFSKAKCSFSP